MQRVPRRAGVLRALPLPVPPTTSSHRIRPVPDRRVTDLRTVKPTVNTLLRTKNSLLLSVVICECLCRISVIYPGRTNAIETENFEALRLYVKFLFKSVPDMGRRCSIQTGAKSAATAQTLYLPFSVALGEAAHPWTATVEEASGQRSAGRSLALPSGLCRPRGGRQQRQRSPERCRWPRETLPPSLPPACQNNVLKFMEN